MYEIRLFDEFQSPIGTQKTMDLLLQERSKIPVSIPYRYTKNENLSKQAFRNLDVSIPYRYTKNPSVSVLFFINI